MQGSIGKKQHTVVEYWLDRVAFDKLLAMGRLVAVVWPREGVTAADRAEQFAEIGQQWTGDEQLTPRSFVIWQQERVVAQATVLPRVIGTSVGQLTIAGLARVATHPDCRGQGLGAVIVRAAFGVVDSGLFAHSLFQTSHKVRPFYDQLGATLVDNPIVNSLADEPSACPFHDEVVMRYPADAEWPVGEIDLLGPGY